MKTIGTVADFIQAHTQTSREYLDSTLAGHTMRIPDIASYAKQLNCLHDFYAPFEELLNGYMSTLLSDYAQRKKAAWLVQDLNEALETEAERTASVKAANDCPTLFRRNFQLHYSNHRC